MITSLLKYNSVSIENVMYKLSNYIKYLRSDVPMYKLYVICRYYAMGIIEG